MTEEDRNVLTGLQISVGKIETALVGNGTKGLAARMIDTEEWQEKHEDAHTLYVKDQHDYRIKREQKEKDEAKAKSIRAWTFVGSAVLIIVGQFIIGVL